LYAILNQCHQNGWAYRIVSNLFPLLTLQSLQLSWDILPDSVEILKSIDKCKTFIANHSVHCSMHPDQFVVIASANDIARQNSLVELESHASLMDMLGLSQDHNSPINIHINCYDFDDVSPILSRLENSLNKLSPGVVRRLTFENEDKNKSWAVSDLYTTVYPKFTVPICYDNLHHFNNSRNIHATDAIMMATTTWPSNIIPTFHFSDHTPDCPPKAMRSHANEAYRFPSEFIDTPCILEMEFKHKDLAIQKFQQEIYNKL